MIEILTGDLDISTLSFHNEDILSRVEVSSSCCMNIIEINWNQPVIFINKLVLPLPNRVKASVRTGNIVKEILKHNYIALLILKHKSCFLGYYGCLPELIYLPPLNFNRSLQYTLVSAIYSLGNDIHRMTMGNLRRSNNSQTASMAIRGSKKSKTSSDMS